MPTLTLDRPENHNFLKPVLYPTVQTTKRLRSFLQCSWRLCYGARLCLWVLCFHDGLYVYSKALGREGCVEISMLKWKILQERMRKSGILVKFRVAGGKLHTLISVLLHGPGFYEKHTALPCSKKVASILTLCKKPMRKSLTLASCLMRL
jgi:hypothetical protein